MEAPTEELRKGCVGVHRDVYGIFMGACRFMNIA